MSTRYADLDRDLVQSLAKGLAVIEAFSAETPAMTLSEVARRTAISPGSAQRILRTLASLGYVGAEDGRFSLKPRALQLGYAYLASLPLTSIAQPMLSALMRATDETCSLALLDGSDVVYVARAPARRLRRDYMAVGTRLPAHATSVGKVLLAALPPAALEAALAQATTQRLTPNTLTDKEAVRTAVRLAAEQGYAINDQEAIMGLRSLGVPVTAGGRVVAAMGLSVEVVRISREELEGRLLPSLRDMAASLSAALGLATTPILPAEYSYP
ncbi:MAG TPA: IclR family transcriptional regulator C-terminal domain-containing protein [Roseomonas sp.]|nr:IclR family transcriptional regulator C-terminal domain-containing protein [Roseomonas sp.]